MSHIFFLHGAFGRPRDMRPLARALQRRGHQTHLFPMGLPIGSRTVEQIAGDLARTLEPCIERGSRISLVGFSLGAVVCRYYLQCLGGRRSVQKYLSLAAPHHGTRAAYLLPFPAIQQLRPNSALLRRLARDEDPWGPVSVAACYSAIDPIIRPPSSARLPAVEQEWSVRVWPHRAILRDKTTLVAATAFLDH